MNKIIIEILPNGCFDVKYQNKSTGQLSWEEMIGVVGQLTVPVRRHCLSWLKTNKERKEKPFG